MSSTTHVKISSLPASVRHASTLELLDPENTGEVNVNEAIQKLVDTQKRNKSLSMGLIGSGFCILLLIASIFGVSFAAVSFAKDSTVDPETGVMYAKGGSHEVLKTAEAGSLKDFDVSDWTAEDFMNAENLFFDEYNLSFAIKGYARSPEENRVVFLVEGGRIEFKGNEIVDVTGDARVLFETVAGVDLLGHDNGRELFNNHYSGKTFHGVYVYQGSRAFWTQELEKRANFNPFAWYNYNHYT